MMKPIVLMSALIAMTACIQVPDFRGGGTAEPEPAAVQMTAKERLVAAMEGAGCVLNPQNVVEIMTTAQLDPSDLERAATELDAEGRIVDANEATSSMRLVSTNCPAA